MALASSSSVTVRAIKEVTFGVIPVSGNPTILRITGETLKFNITKESSKEINNNRTISSVVPTTASASGALNSEVFYAGNDALLESVLQGVWSVYGTNGVGVPVATTAITTTTITATAPTSGINLFTLLQPGQWFSISSAGVNNDKVLRVSTTTPPTSTVITLDVNTPAVASSGESITIESSRLTNGITQTSWTIERQNTDVGVFTAYSGMTPSKLSMSIASGSLSSMSIDFMGKAAKATTVTSLPGTPAASPAYDIHSGVSGATLAVWQDGAPITNTYVKSVSIDFDNTLRSQEAIGTLGAVGIGSGTINCTLQMQVYFKDKTLFDKFVANTNTSFSFSSTDNAGNGYIITIPRANIQDLTSSASGKDQDQMFDIQVTALSDDLNAVVGLRKVIFLDRIGSAVVPVV